MTKGEAYRAYYQANRDKILEANRERAKVRREKLREADEEVKDKHREKLRLKEAKWRDTHYKATFEELSKIAGDDWKPVYAKLATAHNINQITPKMMEILTTLHTASQTPELIITPI
jgi:hypothetical protein